MFQANDTRKQAGLTVLLFEKIDFKSHLVRRFEEIYFITIKGLVHQEDIVTLSIYTPNTGASDFIKQTLVDVRTPRFQHNNAK